MDGRPEGTTQSAEAPWWQRLPRWQLVLGLIFLAYLLFRAGQGAVWLIEQT